MFRVICETLNCKERVKHTRFMFLLTGYMSRVSRVRLYMARELVW